MMRWDDERYVRVYTRDTVTWLALSFDAQALLLMLLRKCDRAGLVDLGERGKRAVALLLNHRTKASELEAALEELLAEGVCVLKGNHIVFPNFMAAQESAQTDAQRKRESRARARDMAAASELVTEHPKDGPDVTPSPVKSESDTTSHPVPSRAVPCRAEPSTTSSPSGDREEGSWNGKALMRAWNDWANRTPTLLPDTRFPQVLKLAGERLKLADARAREWTEAQVAQALEVTARSDWHRGQNDRKWVADFEWFIRPTTIAKALEKAQSGALSKPTPAPERPMTAKELEDEFWPVEEPPPGYVPDPARLASMFAALRKRTNTPPAAPGDTDAE